MDELKNVKGIGPKALSLLEKIGIYTIEDAAWQISKLLKGGSAE